MENINNKNEDSSKFKIWTKKYKAPVVLAGIFGLGAIAAAITVPLTIEWNHKKSDSRKVALQLEKTMNHHYQTEKAIYKLIGDIKETATNFTYNFEDLSSSKTKKHPKYIKIVLQKGTQNAVGTLSVETSVDKKTYTPIDQAIKTKILKDLNKLSSFKNIFDRKPREVSIPRITFTTLNFTGSNGSGTFTKPSAPQGTTVTFKYNNGKTETTLSNGDVITITFVAKPNFKIITTKTLSFTVSGLK